MSYFTQYHDHNFYFSGFKANSPIDSHGYHEHSTLDREQLADDIGISLNHPNAEEIIKLMTDVYRPEDMPSNGSTDGCVGSKKVSNPDTRDLAEQASNPPEQWAIMMQSFQQSIRKLARWARGYNPETMADVRFNKKLSQTRAQMRASPALRVKLEKRWQLLKLCNKALH